MLNIKTDINFSSQQKTNMKVNANSLLYTTFPIWCGGLVVTLKIDYYYYYIDDPKHILCFIKNMN
jgi:hypothetical protein